MHSCVWLREKITEIYIQNLIAAYAVARHLACTHAATNTVAVKPAKITKKKDGKVKKRICMQMCYYHLSKQDNMEASFFPVFWSSREGSIRLGLDYFVLIAFALVSLFVMYDYD